MEKGVGIPRKGPIQDPLSFAGLRADGLRMIQEMCGDTWTDHNLHDPGVTLLEQICYALTDLVYRTDFEVEDHLCQPDGSVPFADQSLHLPGDILPPRPTAPADHRRALLDEVKGLREAWILTSENQKFFGRTVPPAPGVMIAVVRRESTKKWRRRLGDEDLKRWARGVLIGNRNLCEDFDPDIALAEEVHLRLTGQIEISDDRDGEEVLAELKHVAAEYIAGGPKHDSAGEALAMGAPLDEVLSVTAFKGGVSREEDYLGGFARIFKTELTTLIADIDGIEAIHELDWGLFDEEATTANDDVAALRAGKANLKEGDLGDALRRLGWSRGTNRWVVPSLHSVGNVDVSRGGERLRQSERRVIEAQLEQRYQAHRPKRPYEPIRELFDEPVGYWQDLSHYESIQTQLPAYYGLGHDGVPHWADREMKRSTRQTRSYLMIIEQLLVNYLQDLQGLRNWFSTSKVSSARHLGEPVHKSMPGYENPSSRGDQAADPGLAVYKRNPTESLRITLAEVEDAPDRRRRLVDHLLATFGIYESFAGLHEILVGEGDARSPTLADSHDPVDGAAMAWTLGRRIELLRHVPDFTRDRGGSYDAARRLWNGGDNLSGFRRRIGLLLGLAPADFEPRRVADQDRIGFHLVEHVLLRPSGVEVADEDREPPRHFTDDRFWNRMTVVFSDWTTPGKDPASGGSEEKQTESGEAVRAGEYRQYVQSTLREHRPAHIAFDILWLDKREMEAFETAFEEWTTARCRWLNEECQKDGEDCEQLVARSANRLRNTIERLVAAPKRNP